MAREGYYHHLPLDLAAEAAGHLRRQHWRLTQEPTPLVDWPAVTTHAVVYRDNRAINPRWSRRVARQRLGVEPREIAGGHSPFLSRPTELAALLATLYDVRAGTSHRPS